MSFRPRKRFGQNFLTDENIIYKIIESIAPRSSDHLVEIGPGKGALTQSLLESGGVLDAIELDRDLVVYLRNKFESPNNFTLYEEDALNFDFSTLAKANEKLRIVGNLPYNISTALIFRLFEQSHVIEDMHFMFQKEVVDRLTAVPGCKSYGKLSVISQYYSAIEKLFEVPPACFSPTPKVISAVVRLVPHKQFTIEVDNLEVFRKVISKSFSMRRKTLRNNLKTLFSSEEISSLGIEPGRRAETLELEEFAQLANLLYKK
ncbi:MAG: 16S rRNA (adenine(1518)-N(6)/adenine(1519)-N(6))-dimethyltransferase RsmA [Methylococcales bacterium]